MVRTEWQDDIEFAGAEKGFDDGRQGSHTFADGRRSKHEKAAGEPAGDAAHQLHSQPDGNSFAARPTDTDRLGLTEADRHAGTVGNDHGHAASFCVQPQSV